MLVQLTAVGVAESGEGASWEQTYERSQTGSKPSDENDGCERGQSIGGGNGGIGIRTLHFGGGVRGGVVLGLRKLKTASESPTAASEAKERRD